MAGYFIYSMDAEVFEQLTTSPKKSQALLFAESILDGLEDALDEYDDDLAADPEKWPLDQEELAERIQNRLSSADWYKDFTFGDAVIWDEMLRCLQAEVGEDLGVDFQCENDGFLYWDAPALAAKHGASMMAEPNFGNSGFRYSKGSNGDIELMYTFYPPSQVQKLLEQLEKVVPYFESLPVAEEGDREQFFDGLLEPVRDIVKAGRVMWVQTDT